MEKIQTGSHISEDLLSEYALGRIRASEVAPVFEHLLVCDECNDRYEAELEFKTALREAAARAETAAAPARNRSWLDLFAIPKPAWAAVAAVALIAVVIPVVRQEGNGPAQMIELASQRAGQVVTAKANTPLDLRLDTTGASAEGAVVVQVVSSSGTQMWKGAASNDNNRWRVQVDRKLPAGRYWVRVADSAQPDELLREFQLNLE